MTFQELPDDLRQRSLFDDPSLTADAVDLFLRDRDRQAGSLLLLLCDERGRPVQPMMIDEIPSLPSEAMADNLVTMLGQVGVPSVVVALGLRHRRHEHRWLTRFSQRLDELPGLRRIGTFVGYPAGPVEQLRLDPGQGEPARRVAS